MKPVRHSSRSSPAAVRICGRAGATLTEVLMSILIMAVGVVSVFTLFPISVLRTIQATQQTNSKIHKLNTVELLKTSPVLLSAFENGDNVNGTASNYRGEWRPNAVYGANQLIVPTIQPGQVYPSPLLWYRAVPGTDLDGDSQIESGSDEPDWSPQSSVVDGELTWDPVLAGGIPISYVIDPLGYHLAIDDATSPAQRFGNKTDPATGTGTTPASGALLRIHGSLSSTVLAAANVAQADSWEEVVSGTPASATNSAVTFPSTIGLTGAGGLIRRLVLTSTDGQMTVYRGISNVAGQTVNLINAEAIPPRFPGAATNNPDIGLARIENLSLRYTFFLTVRNNVQGQPDIKCVVVFNRNFASASEHVYDANFGSDSVDIDGDGNNDGTQHGLNSGGAWVKISWPNTEPAPLLKPGNWLFDARDVTWYRIQEIFDEGTAAGVNYAVLILDRNVRRQSLAPPSPAGQAMLMPGIVEVFNL